ncbi:hypothetical protein [Chamaesiphon sp. GL140_3_metabinner_50]|uniref:hypothetical protein n=1 Tax=Chamaesiphon sp. GL140_3_metabinner_50 TaxID=2970812 RepID=UPI0025FD8126|nr:hypothetical protein [Chamaesiphon sp. GL140_3_metabinner_50]
MQTIIDNDRLLDFTLENLIGEFQIDVSYLCPREIETAEYELLANQYAYIKFGLILEKFRNQSWWKRCHEKFIDFKDFCKRKVNLSRWQVINAIKSANVAIRLVFLGFSNLPRNASQALAMADLSLERLGEVWGNLTQNLAHHQITTDIIKREITPDAVSLASTIRIPTALLGKLREQARDVGLTLNQYLEQLADGQSPDGSREVEIEPPTDEEIACIDKLELEWQSGNCQPSADKPKSEAILDRIDLKNRDSDESSRIAMDRL